MKTIRKSVFETNSSSTHSISISDGSTLTSMTPNDEGQIVLEGGEFGWEYETYSDPWTKANYCAVDIWAVEEKPTNKQQRDMLIEVLKEQTGANEVIFNFSGDYGSDRNGKPWAYIDHQSHGTSFEAFESKEALRNFIFNRNSILTTDNDNH